MTARLGAVCSANTSHQQWWAGDACRPCRLFCRGRYRPAPPAAPAAPLEPLVPVPGVPVREVPVAPCALEPGVPVPEVPVVPGVLVPGVPVPEVPVVPGALVPEVPVVPGVLVPDVPVVPGVPVPCVSAVSVGVVVPLRSDVDVWVLLVEDVLVLCVAPTGSDNATVNAAAAPAAKTNLLFIRFLRFFLISNSTTRTLSSTPRTRSLSQPQALQLLTGRLSS
jgi:hypothetical protein